MFGRRRASKWIDSQPRCSFCGKHKDQCEKLIAGPGVFICDECVALCGDIIEKERSPG